ncbi:MAG: hypothetical protein WCC81_13105, partial [Pseudolabrys sp.]
AHALHKKSSLPQAKVNTSARSFRARWQTITGSDQSWRWPNDNGNRVCGWRLRLCGVNDDLRRAIFSLKIPAVKPAAWQLKQKSQNNFCRKYVIASRAASAMI